MIHFKIEGKPVPQGRPRAVRMGAGVRMYDPPKSKVYKQMVAARVRSYMKINGIQTITEPLAVHLNFYFTPPNHTARSVYGRLKRRKNYSRNIWTWITLLKL